MPQTIQFFFSLPFMTSIITLITPANPTQPSANVRGRFVAALPNMDTSKRIIPATPRIPSTTNKIVFDAEFFMLNFSFAVCVLMA